MKTKTKKTTAPSMQIVDGKGVEAIVRANYPNKKIAGVTFDVYSIGRRCVVLNAPVEMIGMARGLCIEIEDVTLIYNN